MASIEEASFIYSIDEYETFIALSKISSVQHDLRKLVEVAKVKKAQATTKANDAKKADAEESGKHGEKHEPKKVESNIFYSTMTLFSYEDTPSAMKIYLTVKGAKELDDKDFNLSCTSTSFVFTGKNIQNEHFKFSKTGLFASIVPASCSFKRKTDMILLTLKKVKNEKWTDVLPVEKKSLSTPKVDEDGNEIKPEDSIMSLMKEMYNTGDPQIKKAIAEAFTKGKLDRSE
uniref:Calcyclin-binding protein n=1 Tax=Rhabditophanes sp. KR3021 TaxID=114890 RepID=A0AC35UH38_9BILA